jgi:hypothetical protein
MKCIWDYHKLVFLKRLTQQKLQNFNFLTPNMHKLLTIFAQSHGKLQITRIDLKPLELP